MVGFALKICEKSIHNLNFIIIKLTDKKIKNREVDDFFIYINKKYKKILKKSTKI